ncbi:MAG: response regulator [Paracoccaceae bacterium]
MDARKASVNGLSILIVEDEAFIAFALRTYLEDAAAKQVKTAGNLAEARALLAGTRFDAVILDVRLPDGEGYEIARTCIESGVPVVVHSGHAITQRDGLLSKAVFCAKPATPEELLRALQEAFDRMG